MSLRLDRFDDRCWPSLRELIKTHWAERHPILNKELFDWQYPATDLYRMEGLTSIWRLRPEQ